MVLFPPKVPVPSLCGSTESSNIVMNRGRPLCFLEVSPYLIPIDRLQLSFVLSLLGTGANVQRTRQEKLL